MSDFFKTDDWGFYNADCVDFVSSLPDNSVDFSVYSPPFSSLYIYSESAADMGNVADDQEFIERYRHLIREKLRVTRAGRLSAIHVKDLVYYQNSSKNGDSGLRPFSDMCVQAHIDEGWTFHCRVTIWRDPVNEMYKSKPHGLLWKTFKKDSSFNRVGMPEYLLVFRKWAKDGEEVKPIPNPADEVPLEVWQNLASPVWNYNKSGCGDGDLPATDVLNVKSARDEKAERHLCPMPVNITKRAVRLWSGAGDTVLSPFGGVGSEGIASLELGRKFIGVELNPAYYNQAVKNLKGSCLETQDMFDSVLHKDIVGGK